MGLQLSLVDELEAAIQSGSQERRVQTLRSVTDLFLQDAERLNEAQVSVFDDVLCHLIKRIEAKARVELSAALAPVNNAPAQVICELASDDDISVAEPVLTKSTMLTNEDLIQIAKLKGQKHLNAIAGRSSLDEVVTDVLIDRGDQAVKQRLADNAGALFSERGFSNLVDSAANDETLAKSIGLRIDLPLQMLRTLLEKATRAVRSFLLASAPGEKQEAIKQALLKVSEDVAQEASAPRDFADATQIINAMKSAGTLTENALMAFATDRKYEEMVAAIAALCSASVNLIAPLIKSPRIEGLLIACKAAGIKWPTVTAVMQNRIAHHYLSETELFGARTEYLKLSAETARRTLRFWAVRAEANKIME
jgi:uncharacterized protein (DUF2336 family)